MIENSIQENLLGGIGPADNRMFPRPYRIKENRGVEKSYNLEVYLELVY
jgi:hypothetical protein